MAAADRPAAAQLPELYRVDQVGHNVVVYRGAKAVAAALGSGAIKGHHQPATTPKYVPPPPPPTATAAPYVPPTTAAPPPPTTTTAKPVVVHKPTPVVVPTYNPAPTYKPVYKPTSYVEPHYAYVSVVFLCHLISRFSFSFERICCV